MQCLGLGKSISPETGAGRHFPRLQPVTEKPALLSRSNEVQKQCRTERANNLGKRNAERADTHRIRPPLRQRFAGVTAQGIA